jgi:hypothetical protein
MNELITALVMLCKDSSLAKTEKCLVKYHNCMITMSSADSANGRGLHEDDEDNTRLCLTDIVGSTKLANDFLESGMNNIRKDGKKKQESNDEK